MTQKWTIYTYYVLVEIMQAARVQMLLGYFITKSLISKRGLTKTKIKARIVRVEKV